MICHNQVLCNIKFKKSEYGVSAFRNRRMTPRFPGNRKGNFTAYASRYPEWIFEMGFTFCEADTTIKAFIHYEPIPA